MSGKYYNNFRKQIGKKEKTREVRSEKMDKKTV